jgi:hypothetical protein
MRRKRLEPNSPEAVEAIVRRIRSMTREELQSLFEELSHAPEGVYDPWSEENWPLEKALRDPSNGRAPAAEPEAVESERASAVEGDLAAG